MSIDSLKMYTINNPTYSFKTDNIYSDIYSENDTYIDVLHKSLNQYIRNIHLLINSQPNSIIEKCITEKYLFLLSRLHYLSFSIKDLWDNGIKEYDAYRTLLKDLQASKFGFFELSDLLFAALNPLRATRNEHYYIYQIIDEFMKQNQASEEAFKKILQADSEIISDY